MENSQNSDFDRLSNLPEELILRILTYMPLRDAATTSVLSRFWREKWHHIPNLDFNRYSVGYHPSYIVLRRIAQIISAHRRPILKFSLQLDEPFRYSQIHSVINCVLQRGVQEFTFIPVEYQRHTLPMKFYSHPFLTSLNLSSCHFEPPPTFIGFPRLTSLQLSDVFITSDVLTSLISNCPLIVIIDIESRYLVGPVLIINAPKLKFLTLRAPLMSIRLVSAPHLIKVILKVGLPFEASLFREQRFTELIGFHYPLLATENLQLDHFYLQGLAAARAFDQAAFVCLDTIHLTGLLFELNDVLSTLALTRNCPNLRELTITIYSGWETDEIRDIQRINEDYGSSSFTFSKLKEIKIHSLTGTLLEMEFIKFVLARSPILETMTLIPDSSSSAYEVNKIRSELGQFFQLSLYANISLYADIILEQPINQFRFRDFNGFF